MDDCSERDEVHERRRLRISVAPQYIDAMLAPEPGSSQQITAAFAAALNITHELGHAVWLTGLKHPNWRLWVGEDVQAELGQALEAWLFDGWHPALTELAEEQDPDRKAQLECKAGLHWRKQYRAPIEKQRVLYMYSIPLPYVHKVM